MGCGGATENQTSFCTTARIIRPANTTAYTALDVVGGLFPLSGLGQAGERIMITSVWLRVDIAAVPAGMTSFTLHLYKDKVADIADNAAYDLPEASRYAYVGNIDMGTPVDLGATLFIETNSINKQLTMGDTESLYGMLVTAGGFTPAAGSEEYHVHVQSLGV